MSIRVELEDLAAAVEARGPDAFLASVREEHPHLVAVQVRVLDDGRLVVGAGRRTALNVADRPEVALLWPDTPEHPANSLLVDGTAAAIDGDDDHLAITPTSAILHRAGGRLGRRGSPRTDR